MTLDDFNKLNLDQKCELIWDWGFFISKSEDHEFNKILYSLYGFFTEITLRLHDNRVVDVQTYSNLNEQKQFEFRISKDNPFVRITGPVSAM